MADINAPTMGYRLATPEDLPQLAARAIFTSRYK
jgi:hypothetical protein